MPTRIIAFGVFSHARSVAIFRSPCFQDLAAQKIRLQEPSPAHKFITVGVHLRVLATLLKTPITVTYQIAAAAQRNS